LLQKLLSNFKLKIEKASFVYSKEAFFYSKFIKS